MWICAWLYFQNNRFCSVSSTATAQNNKKQLTVASPEAARPEHDITEIYSTNATFRTCTCSFLLIDTPYRDISGPWIWKRSKRQRNLWQPSMNSFCELCERFLASDLSQFLSGRTQGLWPRPYFWITGLLISDKFPARRCTQTKIFKYANQNVQVRKPKYSSAGQCSKVCEMISTISF